ncbi:MAG: methyltransferase domain-containing protein [Ruminococcaceae bacterium]|nr:methyltransferase domain-containing protein [Oscillospiraceae bacterium]
METLSNGYTLNIPEGAFPLSTDSILLSDFVKLPAQARVLDLGSGCGTLGILLCAKDVNCHITGVELDVTAHEAAQENINANQLSERMQSICADLRNPEQFSSGHFDVCISNPPYFTGGPASHRAPTARRDDHCTTEELFAAAGKMLKFGGDFYLVHKPERLAEICTIAARHKLEPKRLRLIRYRPESGISLILLACRKGGKPGLIWEERCLFDSQQQPTEYYRTLYHL